MQVTTHSKTKLPSEVASVLNEIGREEIEKFNASQNLYDTLTSLGFQIVHRSINVAQQEIDLYIEPIS